jgi:polysaccharide deacetylase 2 family uncharacterized protein YibQ
VLAAPAPPEPPAVTKDEAAIMQRVTDLVVRDTKTWQREHGDQVIPWPEARGHLAIVIDDVGRELHLFEQLLALRQRLTFSVLPGSIYALGVQLRLRGDARRPREIMLHLPMEPADPGMMLAGAEAHETFLLRSDSPAARRAKLEAALSRVPAAVGVNNHMGSALTPDPAAMAEIMEILRDRSLFFVDSRTIATTRAEGAARAAGVPTVPRDVFLDHDPSVAAIEAALDEAARRSRQAPVVAIAHPSAEVVEVLARRLPQLHAEGVGVYPVSRVLAARGAAPEDTDPVEARGGPGPGPS